MNMDRTISNPLIRLTMILLIGALSVIRAGATDPREDFYPTAERLFHISRGVTRNLVC